MGNGEAEDRMGCGVGDEECDWGVSSACTVKGVPLPPDCGVSALSAMRLKRLVRRVIG